MIGLVAGLMAGLAAGLVASLAAGLVAGLAILRFYVIRHAMCMPFDVNREETSV